jgi:hypothetical protein
MDVHRAGQCSRKFYQLTLHRQAAIYLFTKEITCAKRAVQPDKNMKTIIQSVMAGAAVCLLAGCGTTGLSPRESSGASYPNYILSLQSGGTNAPVQKPVTSSGWPSRRLVNPRRRKRCSTN